MFRKNGKSSNFRMKLGRRLFLAQTFALFCGCHSLSSLPKIPFFDKSVEKKGPILTVDGPVTEIRTTTNWQYMAVRFRQRAWEADEIGKEQNLQNNRLAFYNIEFQEPIICSDISLTDRPNPFAVAFNQKGTECLLAYGFRKGLKTETPITVEKFYLTKQKEETGESFTLSDETWIDAVLSPNGDWIAIQKKDGNWEFRDLSVSPPKRVVFPERFDSKSRNIETKVTRVLSFSPNGELAAVLMAPIDPGSVQNQTIAIWDISVARSIPEEKAKKLPLEALFISEFQIRDNSSGNIASFSYDSQMIAVRNKQKYIGIRQTAGGQLLSEFGEHRQTVTALKFSPNNTKLAVGTGDEFGRLVLWDVRKGRLLRTFDSPDRKSRKITAIEFSPDGSLIYFGNDRGGVYQWEYQSEEPKKKKGKKD